MSSTRQYIDGAFKGVAEALYPNLKYVKGTQDEVAQVELAPDQVLFAIFSNYNVVTREISDNVARAENFGVYIGLQDSMQNGAKEVDNIIVSAEIMVNQLLETVESYNEELGIEITGDISQIPWYKRGGNTVSGLWCAFNLNVAQCLPNDYPSLSEYFGKIGAEIDPYDWRGITKNESARIFK